MSLASLQEKRECKSCRNRCPPERWSQRLFQRLKESPSPEVGPAAEAGWSFPLRNPKTTTRKTRRLPPRTERKTIAWSPLVPRNLNLRCGGSRAGWPLVALNTAVTRVIAAVYGFPGDMLTVKTMALTASVAKLLIRVFVGILVTYLLFAGYILRAMRQPPETFGRVMSRMPDAAYLILPFETLWTHARSGRLQNGDPAPDFSLLKLDKSDKVQLSALTSRQPVVLVFGSYT
jgi:hypothetical protein